MKGQTDRRVAVNRRPQTLRNGATEAERKLWQQLRSRQVHGCKFRRQHPFDGFVLDFVCLERKLAVELDGSHHADQLAYDQARTNRLERAGFVVLRFWNSDVFDNIEGVVDVIAGSLMRNENPSPPNPPLEGEG